MQHRHQQFSLGTNKVAAAPARQRHGIRPSIFYAMFAGLLVTNALTLVAFLMSSDISALMSGQTEQIQTAYQDRIVQLRLDVDRLHSRQYAQSGNLNLQLQELAQQQEMLTEQHLYVKALADKAQQLGIETASVPDLDQKIDPTLITGALKATANNQVPDLQKVTTSISNMMDESRQALSALSDAADSSTDMIVSALDKAGITTDIPDDEQDGVGGPYEPLPDDYDQTSLVDDANAVAASFERFRAARDAVSAAPIHAPLAGKMRLTSPYGARKDPFLNKMAFHSGMDFGAVRGTEVHSAGAGTVTFVGVKSGYGNVVEVTHAGGIVTRYAHLSVKLAHVGDKVKAGTVIARVGSTGRSTGPHLHFEVRKNNAPINPAGFLQAGKQLSRFL